MSPSASVLVPLVLTCPAYNPDRLFRRGIFFKPSPSTEAPAPSQPCTISWHAAAALNWGLSQWKTSCGWDRGRETQFTKTIELQIRVYIVSLLLFLSVLELTTCYFFYSLAFSLTPDFKDYFMPQSHRQWGKHRCSSALLVVVLVGLLPDKLGTCTGSRTL